jgi:hypothetical protein
MLALVTEMYDQAATMAQESATIWERSGHQFFLGQARALSGFAACELGNFALARQSFAQALVIGTKHSVILPLLYALPGVALLLAKQGKHAQAIAIYAAASHHPHVANSHWFADVVGKPVAAAACTLPPDIVAAAAAHGCIRDLWEVAGELQAMLQDQGAR